MRDSTSLLQLLVTAGYSLFKFAQWLATKGNSPFALAHAVADGGSDGSDDEDEEEQQNDERCNSHVMTSTWNRTMNAATATS